MEKEEIIIVGGGPCGLAAALSLMDVGKKPLVIEKGNVVHALYHYPTHQTFFSTADKLEIGNYPFITEHYKPKRNEALVYYREVVKRAKIRVNTYEKVLSVEKQDDGTFIVKSDKNEYMAKYVVIATGYYDNPNIMGVPGEDLPKVFHYFKEAHPFFNQKVAVIGGKNSAVDATLELVKAGADVTVIYRGSEFSPSIKPWILPEFQSLISKGIVKMEFNAHVKEITPNSIIYEKKGQMFEIENDFVFAMTGYHPDHSFLRKIGVSIDRETGRPVYDGETMETDVLGVFIAGVIAAGNNANEIFIENGRHHGEQIARAIIERERSL